MNIYKALDNIDKLTDTELKRCVRQLKYEIATYKVNSINYSKEKMLKCGTPYLNKLYNLLSDFECKLNRL